MPFIPVNRIVARAQAGIGGNAEPAGEVTRIVLLNTDAVLSIRQRNGGEGSRIEFINHNQKPWIITEEFSMLLGVIQ